MRRSDVDMGVLSFHNSKETKSLLNVAEDMGFNPVWISDRNLRIDMHSDGVSVEPEVDVVINRMLLSNTRSPIELLGIADAISQNVPVLNHPSNVMSILNKISATSGLSNMQEVKVPDSCFSPVKDCFDDFDADQAVQKRAIGTHGSSVQIVENEDSIISDINGRYSFTQNKIKQDGPEQDLRIYVVGDRVVSTMRRVSAEDEWKTNIAKGATAQHAEISEELESQMVDVVNKFDIDYAGVDAMIDEDGKAKILEVNPTAGFRGLFSATGVCPAPYIVAEAAKVLGVELDSEEIENHNDVLDDSIPDCRPKRVRYEKPKIGIIEETNVAGYSEQKVAKAKIDTGATRTSIDIQLASDLGLGPIKDYVSVKTGSSKEPRKRPVVPLSVRLKGIDHQVDVSIEDREHMKYDLILGRDILQDYQIVPDKNTGISGKPEE